MEANEMTQEQVANQVYGFAADLLVKQQRSPEAVKKALIEKGMDASNARIIVENLQNQIKVAEKEAGKKDMLWGAVWCIGGTVGTFANIGFIFWGAIVFGGAQFIKGAINYFG